ncbi:MAG: S-methyl-5'-thioinosine phosphorylase [Gammaproteobacteria bacterium]|nr:S-methyl-5'-thioinosine phosphorylase [Gammaproteobacteria bacterium]TVQ50268.1 MAG: S-methyl-5'-thioinosine phosphorylase [Gammaproteobacteria bacterium]
MSAEAETRIGLIGGTGLDQPDFLQARRDWPLTTPWGEPSAAPILGEVAGVPVAFVARHGRQHEWPPHRVNYRANLAALKAAGARVVIGLNAVGGIASWLGPGRLALPDQLIDYTWGRCQSLWDGPGEMLHVEFTGPMDEAVRGSLCEAGRGLVQPPTPHGVYGVTQGPRLETRAEIDRLARDGCDMVGMTLMPEAAIARELGLAYACIALSVNWAAGRGDRGLHVEMAESMAAATSAALALLRAALPGLAALPPGIRNPSV